MDSTLQARSDALTAAIVDQNAEIELLRSQLITLANRPCAECGTTPATNWNGPIGTAPVLH